MVGEFFDSGIQDRSAWRCPGDSDYDEERKEKLEPCSGNLLGLMFWFVRKKFVDRTKRLIPATLFRPDRHFNAFAQSEF
jgi:hypothetical protein